MVKYSGPRPVKALVTWPARALDTIYQNLTGRPLLVLVSIEFNRSGASPASSFAVADIGTSSPPNIHVSEAGLVPVNNNPEYICGQLAFMVPPGYYYRVVTTVLGAGSSVLLAYWCEVEL